VVTWVETTSRYFEHYLSVEEHLYEDGVKISKYVVEQTDISDTDGVLGSIYSKDGTGIKPGDVKPGEDVSPGDKPTTDGSKPPIMMKDIEVREFQEKGFADAIHDAQTLVLEHFNTNMKHDLQKAATRRTFLSKIAAKRSAQLQNQNHCGCGKPPCSCRPPPCVRRCAACACSIRANCRMQGSGGVLGPKAPGKASCKAENVKGKPVYGPPMKKIPANCYEFMQMIAEEAMAKYKSIEGSADYEFKVIAYMQKALSVKYTGSTWTVRMSSEASQEFVAEVKITATIGGKEVVFMISRVRDDNSGDESDSESDSSDDSSEENGEFAPIPKKKKEKKIKVEEEDDEGEDEEGEEE